MKRFATFCALAALMLVWKATPLPAAESVADFLGQSMDCNAYAKDLAQLGADKATNPDVKAFARRLLDDHNKMEADLTQLVKEKKIGVATGTNKEHRDKLAELKKTGQGKDFDRKFLQLVAEQHDKELKHLEGCSKDNAFDGACKTVAEKALPVVRKHLEEARDLLKKIDG